MERAVTLSLSQQEVIMLITIHTDNHIQGREDVAQTVEAMVADAIGDFSEWLTRVEVHLSDVNGNKGGDDDKRCVIDAHPKGSSHIAAQHNSSTVREAIDGALEKLMTMLQKIHDKRIDKQRRPGAVKASGIEDSVDTPE
jgi:ribosome-associated translation inhibitor RaiA